MGLLADMMRPRLDAADFEQERNVILEEIARYEDMPRAKIGNRLMEHYFRGHRAEPPGTGHHRNHLRDDRRERCATTGADATARTT